MCNKIVINEFYKYYCKTMRVKVWSFFSIVINTDLSYNVVVLNSLPDIYMTI